MISPHCSLAEATKSNTAIKNGLDNLPNETQLLNMRFLALKVFEPLRAWYGKPIDFNSFFRCVRLNTIIGGSKSSQHCANDGAAADLDVQRIGGKNRDIFDFIRSELVFDQLLWEYGNNEEPDWVHVSYKETGGNRRQVLQVYRDKDRRTKYKVFDLY